MFPNIDKNDTGENVCSHIEVIEFLKEHSKYGYVSEAKKRLEEKGHDISNGKIRKIKSGLLIDWGVLEVLVEMAKENQMAKRRVASLMEN